MAIGKKTGEVTAPVGLGGSASPGLPTLPSITPPQLRGFDVPQGSSQGENSLALAFSGLASGLTGNFDLLGVMQAGIQRQQEQIMALQMKNVEIENQAQVLEHETEFARQMELFKARVQDSMVEKTAGLNLKAQRELAAFQASANRSLEEWAFGAKSRMDSLGEIQKDAGLLTTQVMAHWNDVAAGIKPPDADIVIVDPYKINEATGQPIEVGRFKGMQDAIDSLNSSIDLRVQDPQENKALKSFINKQLAPILWQGDAVMSGHTERQRKIAAEKAAEEARARPERAVTIQVPEVIRRGFVSTGGALGSAATAVGGAGAVASGVAGANPAIRAAATLIQRQKAKRDAEAETRRQRREARRKARQENK
jgi:hypothetical protein